MLARLNALPAEWPRFEAEVAGLVTAARRDVWPDEIGSIVERLEDRAAQAEKLVHAVNPSPQLACTPSAAQRGDCGGRRPVLPEQLRPGSRVARAAKAARIVR